MTVRTPMSVLGGFLGAGKTTLLNRVLFGRHGVRYAVLVNDFGAVAVDGSLVAAHDGETVTFANGCVCCAMGDDLVGTLDRLLDGDRPPEHVLVEASGVADPRAIADVATLHPGLSRDLVVVLADVETVRARYADHRLQDTLRRQLEAADLVVLNKCDRVSEEETRETESWARDRSQAPSIRAIDADIPMELLSPAWLKGHALPALGEVGESATVAVSLTTEPAPNARTGEQGAADSGIDPEPATAAVAPANASFPADGDPSDPQAHEHSPDHLLRFVSRFVPCPDAIDPGRLRTALSALMPRVLRAKGFVCGDASRPEWLIVQACGRTVYIERRSPSLTHGAPAPGIVFIGLDDLPGAAELTDAVRRASMRAAPS